MPVSPVQLTWSYFRAFPWTVSRQAVRLRCHKGHSLSYSAWQCLPKIYTRLREEKTFTDMLKAEKSTKVAAGPAADRCVNVSAWTMHLHQECAATVQLLNWRDLERLCAIAFKTSHIFDRLDYVISLYRGREFTWEHVILIYLQLWQKITEECWPKFKVLAIN